MANLPNEFETDYLVYSISTSISEENEIRKAPLKQVIKRAMFRKFDAWIQEQFYKTLNQ
jgi:hypothetical protein